MSDQIFVKSHVARDLLQSAGLFKNDRLVVWEYVSNGLQYVNPGTNPSVRVSLDSRRKKIAISDNGRGMDWQGLQNFFVLHGENLDRKEGRPGRGRFGTGKSAAFGIADILRITSVRNSKRSKIELRRSDIERMTSEDPIPVKKLEKEEMTTEPNGTFIEIEDVHLRSLDQAGIIRYIERQIAKWPKNASVLINNHECEFVEPPLAEEKRFSAEGNTLELLGDVELVVKVSKTPLDEDLRGISVYSKGVWHETTLGGSEGREMSHYIFGEIDVPKLDEDRSPIAAFDVSRSMRLNPDSELVRAIHAFIGSKVEFVRRKLCDADRKRRAEDEERKLAEHASEIARVINEDFDGFRQRVTRARAKAPGGGDAFKTQGHGGDSDDDLLLGTDLPAVPLPPTDKVLIDIESKPRAPEPPDVIPPAPPPKPPVLEGPPDAEKKGQPAGGTDARRRSKGGFQVKFKPMGAESQRADYFAPERTIYINLDHPQIKAARGSSSIEDPTFKRLSYEVAFSEYSIALAQEMVAHGEFYDLTDPIVEIRDTLNRIARKGALLYS
ncbi:MAG: ATP-binding protein [Verrucomicrobia bacterium]|nr:ATP-binding protein [Verrucomicrobiota bacterium]